MELTKNDQLPEKAETGNASNPTPQRGEQQPSEGGGNQLLGKQAEKNLRESANIEDMPDAVDQQEAEEQLKRSRD